MGCDIHLYVEGRQDEPDWTVVPSPVPPTRWSTDPNEWNADRAYGVFSILAGVRHKDDYDHPPGEPLGLPPDLSPEVAAAHTSWGSDAHSASFLSSDEFCRRVRLLCDPSEDSGWSLICDHIEALQCYARAVFWFDN